MARLNTTIKGGILFFFLGSLTPVSAQLQWNQPKQTFTPQLGEKVVTAKYRFTNTGLSPVTIIDVYTSCGCTSATLAKKTYAPGESGEIEVTFKFAGYTEHQQKWIYVTTNVAGTEPALLTVSVDIPPSVNRISGRIQANSSSPSPFSPR